MRLCVCVCDAAHDTFGLRSLLGLLTKASNLHMPNASQVYCSARDAHVWAVCAVYSAEAQLVSVFCRITAGEWRRYRAIIHQKQSSCILQKHNWWVCSAESQLAIGDVIVQSFTKNKVDVLCRRTTGEYIMQKHSWRVLKLSCNNSPIQIAVAQVVGNGYVTPSFIKQNYICFSTSVSCASILAAYVYMRS